LFSVGLVEVDHRASEGDTGILPASDKNGGVFLFASVLPASGLNLRPILDQFFPQMYHQPPARDLSHYSEKTVPTGFSSGNWLRNIAAS